MLVLSTEIFLHDLFFQNALVELPVGLICLLFPSLIFRNLNPIGKYAARWWAASIISLGFVSILFAGISPNNSSNLVLVGLLPYHILLALFHTRIFNGKHIQPRSSVLYIGFLVHSYFAMRIGSYAYSNKIFDQVIQRLL